MAQKGYISDALFYLVDWILTWVARKECRSKGIIIGKEVYKKKDGSRKG